MRRRVRTGGGPALRARAAAVLLAVAVQCASSGALAAGPSCHCFRDRVYDPAQPGATDEYLLATAANTLLAAACGIPRREIVQARMSGTSAADLWISSYAANRLRLEAGALLKARTGAASWRDVVRSYGRELESLGPRFTAALAASAGDDSLAWAAAAQILATRVGTRWTELDALADRGATLQETVLASLLGLWSSRDAAEVYTDVKAGKAAWSRLLVGVGRSPEQMETEVPKALRPAGR